MSEEPEEVLVQDRAAAVLRDEEVRSRLAVEQEQCQADRQDRQDDHEQGRVDLDRPDEQRDTHPTHPGRPHVVDRREEVDRTDERRDRKQVQREDPEVLAMSRGELAVGERRVAVPAGVRRAVLGEEAQVERDPAEEEQPVRQCVEPREGDVPRSDHQRHEVVREAGEDRHDDEEDHRGAVNREQLVVALAGDEVFVRLRELRAHQQREDPSGTEEDE